MKKAGQIFAAVVGLCGLWCIFSGSLALFGALLPLPPDSRVDFEPWFLALIGVGYFLFGGFLIMLAIILAQDKSNHNQ